MFPLPAVSLKLLRTASPLWTGQTPMTRRSIAADYAITATADTLLQEPP